MMGRADVGKLSRGAETFKGYPLVLQSRQVGGEVRRGEARKRGRVLLLLLGKRWVVIAVIFAVVGGGGRGHGMDLVMDEDGRKMDLDGPRRDACIVYTSVSE
jgi:hypothetical protein